MLIVQLKIAPTRDIICAMISDDLGQRKTWKDYNAGTPGARVGKVPTLTRTLPDGRTQLVKFDGVEGDYLIDRKWSVVDRPPLRAQIVRQSDVLSQYQATGTWEVRTVTERARALRILKTLAVRNIKVRVVEP